MSILCNLSHAVEHLSFFQGKEILQLSEFKGAGSLSKVPPDPPSLIVSLPPVPHPSLTILLVALLLLIWHVIYNCELLQFCFSGWGIYTHVHTHTQIH